MERIEEQRGEVLRGETEIWTERRGMDGWGRTGVCREDWR